jgi:oligopeptide/dipeptide ABC transporter ATP-binding protein
VSAPRSTAAAEASLPTAVDDVIAVHGLKKHYPVKEGVFQRVVGHVKAVDGVDLAVRRGETLGLVGESGCGKSTLARCVTGLEEPTEGGVLFRGHEIRSFDRAQRRDYRRNCQMVFQNVFASLNPRQLVKDIVARPLRVHREVSAADSLEAVVELLENVGLGHEHLYRYPHEFSGGQRQRISIARAIALRPDLLVLDEPTSALDVSVQAQILNLLQELQERLGLGYLFITHDLAVVRHMAARVAVMYLGKVVELGSADDIFAAPRHPYTEALLASSPDLADAVGQGKVELEGRMPDPAQPPTGCRLHTRCPVATRVCGWEVDDVIWWLERSLPTAEPVAVQRHSAQEAELSFDDPDAAGEAAAGLRESAGPLAAALDELGQDGNRLSVRLVEPDPIRLQDLGGEHLTSCLLHVPRRGVAPDPGAAGSNGAPGDKTSPQRSESERRVQ